MQEFSVWSGAFLAGAGGEQAKVKWACGDLGAAAVGEEVGCEGAHVG